MTFAELSLFASVHSVILDIRSPADVRVETNINILMAFSSCREERYDSFV